MDKERKARTIESPTAAFLEVGLCSQCGVGLINVIEGEETHHRVQVSNRYFEF